MVINGVLYYESNIAVLVILVVAVFIIFTMVFIALKNKRNGIVPTKERKYYPNHQSAMQKNHRDVFVSGIKGGSVMNMRHNNFNKR